MCSNAASVSSPDGGRGRLRGGHRLELAAAGARVVFLTAAHALEPKLPPCVPDSTEQREPTMTRGMPSMTALLGLLALAGYQKSVRFVSHNKQGLEIPEVFVGAPVFA